MGDNITSLVFNNMVSKTHIIFEVIGSIDELNAIIMKTNVSFCNLEQKNDHIYNVTKIFEKLSTDLQTIMTILSNLDIQNNSFNKSQLNCEESIKILIINIENIIRLVKPFIESTIQMQKNINWNTAHYDLNISRTVSRRVERNVWILHEHLFGNSVVALIGKYMNRLSDLLYNLSMTKNIVWNNK